LIYRPGTTRCSFTDSAGLANFKKRLRKKETRRGAHRREAWRVLLLTLWPISSEGATAVSHAQALEIAARL
jgi:hypothetical protein